MSRYELNTRTLNLFTILWWKFVPGTTVVFTNPGYCEWTDNLPLPGANMTVTSFGERSKYIQIFSDYLAKNIGKHGRDWNWKIVEPDKIAIKVRKSKEPKLTMFLMKFNLLG